jgi:uncharacterized membrane protein YccF (DUF307 family)
MAGLQLKMLLVLEINHQALIYLLSFLSIGGRFMTLVCFLRCLLCLSLVVGVPFVVCASHFSLKVHGLIPFEPLLLVKQWMKMLA